MLALKVVLLLSLAILGSSKSFLVLLGPAEEVQQMTPEEEQQFEDLERTYVLWQRKLPNGDLLIKINEEDIEYTLYKSGINKTSPEILILGLGSFLLVLIILLFWRSEKNNSASDEF